MVAGVGLVVLLGTATWAVLCVLLCAGAPGTPSVARVLAALVVVAGSGILWWQLDSAWRLWLPLGLCLAIGFAMRSLSPPTDRAWALDHERAPSVAIEGSTATVSDFRTFRYPGADSVEAHWTSQAFRLDQLTGCDFVVVPFQEAPKLAHTMLSFRFAEGPNLALSIEARREKGEAYSVSRALFCQYPLIYVLGTEDDLIGVRGGRRRDTVYVFPVQGDLASMRGILEDLLRTTEDLYQRPRWYHTLRSNCTTNLVRSYERATGRKVAFDMRLLLPGSSAEVLYDLGLLDTSVPYAELQDAHRSAPLPDSLPDDLALSDWIRGRYRSATRDVDD